MGLPYGESGGPRVASGGEHDVWGPYHIRQSPGLPAQQIGERCLGDIIEENISGKGHPSAADLLDHTTDTDGQIIPKGSLGASVTRHCGRIGCEAECTITVGTWCLARDITYPVNKSPENNCVEHPIKRRLSRILKVLR
jgi:hypothetical protein